MSSGNALAKEMIERILYLQSEADRQRDQARRYQDQASSLLHTVERSLGKQFVINGQSYKIEGSMVRGFEGLCCLMDNPDVKVIKE